MTEHTQEIQVEKVAVEYISSCVVYNILEPVKSSEKLCLSQLLNQHGTS